jgi:UDP:flavonoid glycosyltransferase YjiC (YdhE family)
VARRADVIVCDGGFGSTLGSLAHGAPLVILPLFSGDRWANGEAVVRAGAGVTVADDRTVRNVLDLPRAKTLGRLAGAVTSVLNDASYRREAGRIAEAVQVRASARDTRPVLYAGTEVVEFSPSEELGRRLEVVTKNMEEMEASA